MTYIRWLFVFTGIFFVGQISLVFGQTTSVCVSTFLRETNRGTENGLGVTLAEASDLIHQVGTSIGVGWDIVVVPCDFIDKAEAWYSDGNIAAVPEGEYIIYNPSWLQEVAGNDRTQAIAIFGHEFGHFLNRHFTARRYLGPQQKEAEADKFAGCAVARMNGDWADLENLFARIRSEKATALYPGRLESIEQAQSGFRSCSSTIASVNDPIAFSALLNYEGPSLKTPVRQASSLFPTGAWERTANGGRRFRYATLAFGRDAEMYLYVAAKSRAFDSLELTFTTMFRHSETPASAALVGIEKEVEETCVNFHERLSAHFVRLRGEPDDGPNYETSNITGNINFATPECGSAAKAWQCSRAGYRKVADETFGGPDGRLLLGKRFEMSLSVAVSVGDSNSLKYVRSVDCKVRIMFDATRPDKD